MSIIQMEPTRQTVRAIMSPSRAAHLARWADRTQVQAFRIAAVE